MSTPIRNKKSPSEKTNLLQYGSYMIDAIILRIKTQEARNWTEKFMEETEGVFPVKILIRVNPYRTLQILWFEHFRVALKGQNLKRFLEIAKIDDISLENVLDDVLDEEFAIKGVRVIPIAPAWLPQNRILVEMLMEYLMGRLPLDLIKKIFYSAFIKLFDRESITLLNIQENPKSSTEKKNLEDDDVKSIETFSL